MTINVPAGSSMCQGLTVEQFLSQRDMVRRISGKYKVNTVSHLKSNNNDITDAMDICNTLAEQLAFNFSSENYSHKFNRHRLTVERRKIEFDTNDHYSYNDV